MLVNVVGIWIFKKFLLRFGEVSIRINYLVGEVFCIDEWSIGVFGCFLFVVFGGLAGLLGGLDESSVIKK